MVLNKLLNIKYPIIQGAMANIATAEFAACVSQCGGLGIIATGSLSAEQTRIEIQKCKQLTNQPFGVNIMLMNPYASEIVDVIIEEGVPVVTTGAGNPGAYMAKFKEAGIKVFPVVPSVGLAKRMERAGADALIVEGGESGGHVGEMTTMALVPQVVDAVNIPVIAAGGIADGRGMIAAFALGACGVQVGTCLLVADECPIHENYKEAVIKAKDTDTVVTGKSVNTPVRSLKNQMTREYLKLESHIESREELEKLTLGGLRKAVHDGDVKTGSVMMGQIAGMIQEKKPMQQILNEMMESTEAVYQSLSKVMEEI
ncbi:MAG: enoyl-[acyl-carrier-protein] reductase FabK [Coprobacillus cateniformis]|nr:enoyl-[acyl-carrier-protein] reductase FabK [Coprobacillus cateniformis]PWM87798.1 MAG: enoyl-[acyl-carrier-protein] reductase FabK [Coprobacillus sp.]MBS5599167.1 enoyl-[acyl-carrier-protein] reductase FabK [Coprobacillus cateniformis]MVX26958.1 enoyl-[acyl-carrier-protein] reductase FabK [Coprobacillus cateniformis]RGO12914.1 enoyl-[acyl-carrier-protein] reductase FabK [Coprobacillus cateniformis]RGO22751.1 enoyl-[acyl-carrier-protein] reductase FabK [Coprobacillus cateniformis]